MNNNAIAFVTGIALMCCAYLDACTNILISTKDGNKLVGRSMEFGQFLKSQVMVTPKGQKLQSNAPNNAQGLSWTSKYNFIALNGFGTDLIVDGLNEKGLSYGALWLPGTEYQQVNDPSKAISTNLFGNWILGNFATVDEVKNAIKNVQVWGQPIASLGNSVPPAHMAIHDAQGNGAVFEFNKGELKVYDNPVGVLTNFPWFDWQLINLQNFINLKALNAGPVKMSGLALGGTGQGSGLMGIPGDWTPPSRFVRAVNFKEFSKQAKNAIEGVNLLAHLLNTVDIPLGDVKESDTIFDYTQWIVIKDLTNKQFYFRTYENLNLHQIDFAKLDLKSGGPTLKMDLPLQTTFINATDGLK